MVCYKSGKFCVWNGLMLSGLIMVLSFMMSRGVLMNVI